MLKLLQKTRGNMSVSHAIVFKWHHWFKDGRQNLDDNERQGQEESHSHVQCNVKVALCSTLIRLIFYAKLKIKVSVYFVTRMFSFIFNIVSTQIKHKNENRRIDFDTLNFRK